MMPSTDPGSTISQKYSPPFSRTTSQANSAPRIMPAMMPAASESTLRANQPISTPTSTPLMVEPKTIERICGAVSGAETSALRPSNTPSTPPSTRPSTGLFMRALRRGSKVVRPSVTEPAGVPLIREQCDQESHDDVCKDEQDRRAINPGDASDPLESGLLVGVHGLARAVARDFAGEGGGIVVTRVGGKSERRTTDCLQLP